MTGLMEVRDLPEWVWDLVDRLAEYEEVHPVLWQQKPDDSYIRAECASAIAGAIIPAEVLEVAALMRERNRRRDPWVKSQAWDEGWSAFAEQDRLQRADPSHPITRVNPHEEVPF